MSASAKEIRRTLDATLISVKTKYESCTSAAKRLVRAYSVLLRAEETREIKNSSRAINAYARAESAFKLSKKEYFSAYKHYEELLSEALRLYSDLIDLEQSHRLARKLTAEMSRFEAKADANKEALLRRLSEAALAIDEEPVAASEASRVDSEPKAETAEHVYREERRESYAPPYSPYGSMYPPQVAPASIDISGIVEDAVRTAMSKFLSVFEKRMNEYEAALEEIKVPAAVANAPRSEAEESFTGDTAEDKASSETGEESLVPEMEMAVAYEEERILEKLGEIVEKLKRVSESLTELGASAIELAGAEAAAVEEQKRANDMQRRTARDIQGVLVNQKLISGEAAELAGAQAAAIEEQKANIENQKLIGTAQAEIAEMEKSIIEASAALGESVRELMSSQKSLISQQTSLINANAKNIDSQRELTERQAEVAAMQKAVEKEHKALTRDPRRRAKTKSDTAGEEGGEDSSVSKIAEGIVEKKASENHGDGMTSAAEEIGCGSAESLNVEDGTAVPDEVDLDSIKDEE